MQVEINNRFNVPYWHLSETDASLTAKALSRIHKKNEGEIYTRRWSKWLRTKTETIKMVWGLWI